MLPSKLPLACDETVVHAGAETRTYLAGLLKVCRFQIAEAVPGVSAMTGSDLKQRMELIMCYSSSDQNPRAPRTLLIILAVTVVLVPLLGGLVKAQSGETRGGDCAYNSIKYPSGTVLQMGKRSGAPKKACVNGAWAPTTKAVTMVAQDLSPSVACTPAPSKSANECVCEEPGAFSLGAIVNTKNGRMRCDKFQLGQFTTWRLATANELGLK